MIDCAVLNDAIANTQAAAEINRRTAAIHHQLSQEELEKDYLALAVIQDKVVVVLLKNICEPRP